MVPFVAAAALICGTGPAVAQVREGGAEIPTTVVLLTFDFSSDGSMFVAGGDSIRLYDTESGQMLHQLPSRKLVRTARFSPTDRDLFATTADDGAIRIWRVGETEALKVFSSPAGRVHDIAFSPDGSQIAGCELDTARDGRTGALRIWNVETGELDQSLEVENFFVSGVAFSRDGKFVAFSKIPMDREDQEQTASIEIHNNEMWQPVRSIPCSPGSASSVSFAPDGSRILIAGNEHIPSGTGGTLAKGRLWLASLESDEPAKLLTPLDSSSFRSAATFMPEGDAFALGTTVIRYGRPLRDGRPSSASVVAQIQIRDADSGEVRWSQDGEIGDPYDVTVSPDGRWVGCCTGKKLLILDAKNGESVHAIAVGE